MLQNEPFEERMKLIHGPNKWAKISLDPEQETKDEGN